MQIAVKVYAWIQKFPAKSVWGGISEWKQAEEWQIVLDMSILFLEQILPLGENQKKSSFSPWGFCIQDWPCATQISLSPWESKGESLPWNKKRELLYIIIAQNKQNV